MTLQLSQAQDSTAASLAQVPDSTASNLSLLGRRLAFTRQLQAVTNKIHATANIDQIILEVSQEICALLEAERITVYVTGDKNDTIISKVKTGLNAPQHIILPVNDRSIAGYCALKRQVVAINDAYDEDELKGINPELRFNREIDRQTGFRTRQVLVAPILDPDSQELRGVLQLINTLSGLPFDELMREGATEVAKTLAIAFRQRSQLPFHIRAKYTTLLGTQLTDAQLEQAARVARADSRDLDEVLGSEFRVPAAAIGAALAGYYRVPYEPYKADRLRPIDLLRNLKREYVASNRWLPIEDGPSGIVILTTDPEQLRGTSIVRQVFPKAKLEYRVCSQPEFDQTVELFFGKGGTASIGELLATLEEDAGEDAVADELSEATDNELVKLVNKIILDAYQQGASDIHIEPYSGKHKTEVRFRKDGTLFPYIELPANYRNPLIARIKIMCDLDISEKRRPQDGKIAFKRFGPADIELRVATIPTAGGMEDIVMRILAAGKPIPLPELGLSRYNLEQFRAVIEKPYGLVLVCGPTGSGKTTTLHSALGHLNQPGTKIWTAEDPVEITQKGLRQVQVNNKAGYTFAHAMRAFLRADPDVIMVGEMRDEETVSIGVEASLTGHLVFSTLHTNSAPESIVRLLDMGMDAFNFADALLGVLAQRLTKRLCPACKQAHPASEAEIQALLREYCEELRQSAAWQTGAAAAEARVLDAWRQAYGDPAGQLTLYTAPGCDACDGTGYKGRLGLHELLVGSDRVKALIQASAPVHDIWAAAIDEGMRTLKQDGIEKILLGLTDLKQVRAVCIR